MLRDSLTSLIHPIIYHPFPSSQPVLSLSQIILFHQSNETALISHAAHSASAPESKSLHHPIPALRTASHRYGGRIRYRRSYGGVWGYGIVFFQNALMKM
jgi:hypothetical protein